MSTDWPILDVSHEWNLTGWRGMVTFNDLGLFGDRQVCIGSPCARVSDPEASQQGPARECHCYPWSGLHALQRGSREILAAETGPEVTHGAGIPPPVGQLMELRVTGPATLPRGTREPEGLEWGGKGGGQWTRPLSRALDTLSLVATFERRVTAPSDLS